MVCLSCLHASSNLVTLNIHNSFTWYGFGEEMLAFFLWCFPGKIWRLNFVARCLMRAIQYCTARELLAAFGTCRLFMRFLCTVCEQN